MQAPPHRNRQEPKAMPTTSQPPNSSEVAGSESSIPTLLYEMHSEDYTTALQPVPAPFQVSGCPKEPSLVTILGRSDGPAAEAWKGIGIELQDDSRWFYINAIHI